MFKNKITIEEIKLLPQKHFSGNIIVVDTPELCAEAVECLRNQPVLGFDTETKPSFRKGTKNKVALLQLSAGTVCYIFRLNKIEFNQQIAGILAHPGIIKTGVGIDDDIKSLRRICEFKPAAFVELQKFVKPYGIEDNSLRKLAAIVLGVNISKSQRLSNWELPVLSEQQQIYAATDAWVGFEIYSTLIQIEPTQSSTAE